MAYKILTKKGIENTNIDGARENFFNSGMRDGIVKGAFNEGNFLSNSSNSIYLDSCELRIAGHRVVIDEPAYKTFSNIPSKDTRYSMIAQILVSESADVEFSLFVQSAETVLIKDNLYATGTGQGTYQVEIGRFTLTDKGTVEDVVKTIDNITGTTESIAGGINIGNVTTEKIDYKFDAEVDVTQRYDSEQKKTFTDFNFQIPTQYPVDLDAVEKSVEEAKTNSTNALQTASNAKTLAEQAQQQASELEIKKADRTELFSGSYNDLKDKPNIPDTSNFLHLSGGTITGDINLGTSQGLQGTTSSGGKFDIFRLQNSTTLQVGGSYPLLALKGKGDRPTYNGSNVALSTDIPDVSSFLSASTTFATKGKMQLSNGLILLWGLSDSSQTGTFTVNFWNPFPNNCFAVVHSQYRASNDDYDKTTMQSYDKNGFKMQSSSYGMRYVYIAIGN